ncbi:MAG: hypothetical protein ACOVNU_04440 [Candidatus Kapaibacteriota bacterium]
MRQTAAVSIGILRLNEDFVQMNEVMTIWYFLLHFYLNIDYPIYCGRSLHIRKLSLD